MGKESNMCVVRKDVRSMAIDGAKQRLFSRHVAMVFLFGLIAGRVNAALPQVSDPSRGVTAGNYIKLFQDYLYDIFLVGGLLVACLALFKVAAGSISVYHEVQEGKKKWGDLGMHLGAGVVLLVIIVALVTQASGVL
jgi:integrating conjugative element membrane protein (TIGR03745 family)